MRVLRRSMAQRTCGKSKGACGDEYEMPSNSARNEILLAKFKDISCLPLYAVETEKEIETIMKAAIRTEYGHRTKGIALTRLMKLWVWS